MASRNGSTPYVECRTLRHAWDPMTTREGWSLSLLCVRCATERHDDFDGVTGELDARRYIYPSGYKLTAGTTPAMQDLRVELMRRIRSGNSRKIRTR